MAVFTLTTGSDTVIGTDTDDTVYGTSATLNAGEPDGRRGNGCFGAGRQRQL